MLWIRAKYNKLEAAMLAREQPRKLSRREMISEYNRVAAEMFRDTHAPPILLTEYDCDVEERFRALMSDLANARRARLLNAALVTASNLLRSNDTRRLIVSPLSQKIGVDDVSQNPIVRCLFDIITVSLASYQCSEPSLSAACDRESPDG